MRREAEQHGGACVRNAKAPSSSSPKASPIARKLGYSIILNSCERASLCTCLPHTSKSFF